MTLPNRIALVLLIINAALCVATITTAVLSGRRSRRQTAENARLGRGLVGDFKMYADLLYERSPASPRCGATRRWEDVDVIRSCDRPDGHEGPHSADNRTYQWSRGL